jgi:hypothetical protein
MAYTAQSRTKVVPEGRRFQARYYDADLRLWFDLGDPKDTEEQARALIAATKADHG